MPLVRWTPDHGVDLGPQHQSKWKTTSTLERPVRSSRDYDGQYPPSIRYLILAQSEDRALQTVRLHFSPARRSASSSTGSRRRGPTTEIEPRSGEKRSQPHTQEGAPIALFERVAEASVRGP